LTGHTLLSALGEGVNDLITCQRAVSRWLFYAVTPPFRIGLSIKAKSLEQ
jgi:hypothetical protein